MLSHLSEAVAHIHSFLFIATFLYYKGRHISLGLTNHEIQVDLFLPGLRPSIAPLAWTLPGLRRLEHDHRRTASTDGKGTSPCHEGDAAGGDPDWEDRSGR